MRTFLRFILFLSLIVWLGGIIFFSFVVTPTLFSILGESSQGRELAGHIVRGSLSDLHLLGSFFGIMGIIASAFLNKSIWRKHTILLWIMITVTSFSQFGIMKRMDNIRAQSSDLEHAPPPYQESFRHLHQLSVATEGTVLLLGLVVVWLIAKDRE